MSHDRLEDALRVYPGCVVLVTHDDVFAGNVASRSIEVANGGVL